MGMELIITPPLPFLVNLKPLTCTAPPLRHCRHAYTCLHLGSKEKGKGILSFILGFGFLFWGLFVGFYPGSISLIVLGRLLLVKSVGMN